MRYVPHDYQTRAVAHILAHEKAALFLDMGLGKTIITLTAIKGLLALNEISRVLIIAPKRVAIATWPDEILKWEHTQNLGFTVLAGLPPEQRTAALSDSSPIHIINRENVPWLVRQVGKTWPYDMLVIDELSSFKTPSAARFKALKKILPRVNRVVGLTGTPAPNGLLDLWSQFFLLDGGKALGGTFTGFRSRWFHATKYIRSVPVDWALDDGADEAIHQAIAPITLSMQAGDYLTLPPLRVVDREVVLPVSVLERYRVFKRDLVAEVGGAELVASSAAVLAGKLLQFVSGAVYAEPLFDWAPPETNVNPVLTQADTREVVEVHQAKLDALGDVIEAANGQSVLIAFWYQHERQRILARFPHARLIDSPESIRAWQNCEIPIGLIHPASAGHGLNLQTGGHFLVWFTPIWNLELYQQANARLYRQGQPQPVTVLRLVAKNTIDQRVVQALERKDTTQTGLIEALKQEITTNEREEK